MKHLAAHNKLEQNTSRKELTLGEKTGNYTDNTPNAL